jgi:putative ABC transport system substrate-binding protein
MTVTIGRRELLAAVGGAATVSPFAVAAQQSAIPVIGFLDATTPVETVYRVSAFRDGLKEAGFIDGHNVAIEFRWAENKLDRLPALAADLAHRQVAVIVGPITALRMALAATSTIPIVFVSGGDPIAIGLVTNLGRPGGNITGVSTMNSELGPKRLGLMIELMPGATRFAVLANPNSPDTEAHITDLRAAAAILGLQVETLMAKTNLDIDANFASFGQKRVEALLVSPGPPFGQRRAQLATLAARHGVPTIYPDRMYAEAGGLMSYGSNVTEMYRQAGI